MAEIGTLEEKNDNSQEIDYFSSLPDELLIIIFSLLPQTELPRYARVCRRWLRITSDECLWSIANLGSVKIPLPSLAKLVQRGVRSLNLPCAKIADPYPWRRCFPKKYKSKLQTLNLSKIEISNRGLAHLLKPCRELLHLELTNADLNRESCEAIGNNAQLQSLTLLECRGIDARGLTAILKGCQKLEEIGLNHANLSLDALNAMTSNISSTVTSLSLWKCSDRFEDRHVFDLVDRCPNLRYLNIKANIQLTQAAYDKALTLKYLEELVEGPDGSFEEGGFYLDPDSENYFSDDYDGESDFGFDNQFDDMDHSHEDAMNVDDGNDEIVDFGNIEPGDYNYLDVAFILLALSVEDDWCTEVDWCTDSDEFEFDSNENTDDTSDEHEGSASGDNNEDMSCNVGHYNMVHHVNVSVNEEDDSQSFDELYHNPNHTNDGDEDIVIDYDDDNDEVDAGHNDDVYAGDNDFDNYYVSDDDNEVDANDNDVDANDNEVDAGDVFVDWDIDEDDGDAGDYF